MANREVIKEFLVSLGFTIDQPGIGKFKESLTSITKFAGFASKAIFAIAASSEAMVVAFASSMEKMYYASRRTRTSVENLQAFEYGAKQIGISADEARGALEAMSKGLRTQPGLIGILKGLGINPEGKQNLELLHELVTKLAKYPHFVGAQFAEMFGISEEMFFMLKDGGMQKLMDAEKERIEMNKRAGISADDAAKASKEYMNALRGVWERVTVLGQTMAVKLLPYFQDFIEVVNLALDDLIEFKGLPFEEQIGRWAEAISDFGKQAKKAWDLVMPESVKKFFGWVTDKFSDLAGLNQKPEVTVHHKGEKSTVTRVVNGQEITVHHKGTSQPTPIEDTRGYTPIANTINKFVEKITGEKAPDRAPLGLRQNNPGNLRSWGANEVRNGFAVFQSAEEGLSAMAGNLLKYGKGGFDTINKIINRWAPSTDNDTSSYVKNVTKSLGVDENKTLNLRDPTVLSKLMDAMIRQEQGYNPYGMSELMSASNARLGNPGGNSGVTLNQQTTINVNGTGDPATTAKYVGQDQRRVNGDIVRNFASVPK